MALRERSVPGEGPLIVLNYVGPPLKSAVIGLDNINKVQDEEDKILKALRTLIYKRDAPQLLN